jgi:hypothetical protein
VAKTLRLPAHIESLLENNPNKGSNTFLYLHRFFIWCSKENCQSQSDVSEVDKVDIHTELALREKPCLYRLSFAGRQ